MFLKPVAKCLIPVLTLLWSAGLLAGTLWLIDHSNKPGDSGIKIACWPRETQLERHPDKPQILVFVHPRCPCSEVTLAELANQFQKSPSPYSINLVISTTQDLPIPENLIRYFEKWCRSTGAQLVRDTGRVEARRFGVTTSGQVFVFNRDGSLLFQGGVTAGRGHQGENPGLSSLQEILTNSQPRGSSRDCFNTYGCPLFEDRS